MNNRAAKGNYSLRIPVPGVVGRALSRFTKSADALAQRLLGAIGDRERYFYPDLSRVEHQLITYASSPWVAIAVDKISTPASLINLEVFALDGEKETPISNHPIEQLFRKPNTYTSQFEFFQLSFMYYLITGNCYWFLVGETGAPSELLMLRPDRMVVAAGEDAGSPIRGYIYNIDGLEIPLPRGRVIHFKRPNPHNDFYGFSPLHPAALSVNTDNAQARWNFKFFGKNRAVPSAIVSFPVTMDDPTYDRAKEEWLENHGGEQTTAFIRGDKITVTELAQTHKEMDFMAARQFNKETVLLIYGIPPGALDKNSTEANSTVGNTILIDQTVYPLMTAFAQKITAELAPYYGDRLVIRPQDIRSKDAAMEQAEITTARSYLTIDEVRQKYYGLPPLPEGGDVTAPIAERAAAPQTPGFFGHMAAVATPSVKPEPDAPAAELPPDKPLELPAPAPSKALPPSEPPNTGVPLALLLGFGNQLDLLQIQNELKARYGGVQWSDPSSLHITLAVANVTGNLQRIYEVLPREMPSFIARVVGADVFENNGERAFHLTIEPSDSLAAFQYSLYMQLVDCGAALSPFSVPTNWKPHITLGYLLPDAPVPIWGGQPFDMASHCLDVSIKVGDEFIVPLTIKAAAPPAPIPEPPPAEEETQVIPLPPRVHYGHDLRKMLGQFVRFYHPDRPIDAFRFIDQPKAIDIAVKAFADTFEDVHEVAILSPDYSPGIKSEGRISITGVVDPLAAEKDKAEAALADAMTSYLAKLQKRVIDTVREAARHASMKRIPGSLEDYKTFLDDAFWNDMFDLLKKSMQGTMQGTIQDAAEQSAKLLIEKLGYAIDTSVFATTAAKFAEKFTDQILQKFHTTSRDGTGALLSRWINTDGATVSDLIGAFQESQLFSGNRASLVATTEITRAYAGGERIAARGMADEAGVDVRYQEAEGLIPVHPNCRCWWTTIAVRDDNGKIIAFDMVFNTSRDAFVCSLCDPMNGQLASELGAA